ncbi:unnamed protein product [Parnassius apollo]|uniref:(apollo) hypothetical protein n=1 Tax=Parnassius apollo TaxID=110799 RepID=A0A8S3XC96_PARAO|nr:unnamed protein product [Parnassius apollo]
MIKCNGCKAEYHYRCVNITSAAFREEREHLKRTFKCDFCLNITQRIRVTDDTSVRGVRTACLVEHNQSFEGNVSQAIAESLTSDEIIDKVERVIMANICAFEINIIQEIKNTVAVLALENSKLRQDLKDANMKCSFYEQQIKCLKAKRQVLR